MTTQLAVDENAVLVDVSNHIATITLNRPRKLNAINKAVITSLGDALRQAEADDDVRVVVITGAGGNFSAGYDIANSSVVASPDAATAHHYLSAEAALTMQLWGLAKPTIAAVDGWCLAGGFDTVLACDIVVASERAQFGMPEIRYGSGPVTLLLPYMVGQKLSNEIFFTGDSFTASQAKDMGLVNRVVADDELQKAVNELAAKIVPTPLPILKFTKLGLLRAYESMGLRQGVQANLDLSAILNKAVTEEGAEFFRIVEQDGLGAALKWRDKRYGTTA
ncbi:enoyl-CoA hydratase/isomerase family protein [Mycolicibacterium baixiangningiae]|uniref:enoyl-CoA hydratase/isomerase family protein n=1 Tax=Mycolicibacterium baixiangningiae TaxID=2761578 RepID=UPI001867BD1E|nr:enoyl-CoA hydratase/isomerase family protein [Mycolicibacterium baixiangningiae]